MEKFKASDRELSTWYSKIKLGEIMLPRFQRFEAWDRKRISSLLQVLANNLPLGITLILKTDREPQFISRFIETAPEKYENVSELLLDGQQRLTAFWRMMNNNYENETYFLYIPDWDKDSTPPNEDSIIGYCQPRWYREVNGKISKYPIWADDPVTCFYKGLLPTQLLRPENIENEINDWVNKALNAISPDKNSPEYLKKLEEYTKKIEQKESIKKTITDLREIIFHYNLPYLQLESSTRKDIALNVFINMNTNSKPLSVYDIVVAEVESVKGQSLHDLVENLDSKYPKIKKYFELEYLTLYTSALLQDKLPNQRGIMDMDKKILVDKWDLVEFSLNEMTNLLESQGIYDRQRLPTNAILAVVAGILANQNLKPDKKGQINTLLKKYIWRAFFTDRYENTAATRAYADFKALKSYLNEEIKDKETNSIFTIDDIPIFNEKEFPIAGVEELMSVKWPKGENIRARGILAVSTLLGALDFADAKPIRENIDLRDYHHIYPDALLKEAKIESSLALNCALITGSTNKVIGRKDPLQYLKDRYSWTSEEIVNQRLQSHLIPIKELANGGYENITDEFKKQKIRDDFSNFLLARANLIHIAVQKLCDGKSITYSEIYSEYTDNLKYLKVGNNENNLS